MNSTVKYTDDTRDSRTEKLEWKIRRDRIQHATDSPDLAPFDFKFSTQLKSDLHGKRFSNLDELRIESDLKKTCFRDIYGKWVQQQRKCIQHQEEYSEKLCHSLD